MQQQLSRRHIVKAIVKHNQVSNLKVSEKLTTGHNAALSRGKTSSAARKFMGRRYRVLSWIHNAIPCRRAFSPTPCKTQRAVRACMIGKLLRPFPQSRRDLKYYKVGAERKRNREWERCVIFARMDWNLRMCMEYLIAVRCAVSCTFFYLAILNYWVIGLGWVWGCIGSLDFI